jgi:hypothetical protein
MQTRGELEDLLWEELGWRKKELLQVRMQALSAPEWATGMQIRSGVTLLYAHWEGFVRTSGEALVEFVRDQQLNLGELAPGYLAIALRKQLAEVRESRAGATSPEIAMTQAISDGYNRPAQLKANGSVPTASNLSWKQFAMVAARLGFEVNEFSLLQNFIDVRLVGSRNTIAHGDRIAPMDREEFVGMHAKVLGLLDRVAHQVMRVADNRLYEG